MASVEFGSHFWGGPGWRWVEHFAHWGIALAKRALLQCFERHAPIACPAFGEGGSGRRTRERGPEIDAESAAGNGSRLLSGLRFERV